MSGDACRVLLYKGQFNNFMDTYVHGPLMQFGFCLKKCNVTHPQKNPCWSYNLFVSYIRFQTWFRQFLFYGLEFIFRFRIGHYSIYIYIYCIRWKPTHSCKLCKLRSGTHDLDPKAMERGGGILDLDRASLIGVCIVCTSELVCTLYIYHLQCTLLYYISWHATCLNQHRFHHLGMYVFSST
jgi:hypothetical protein